MQCLFCKQDSSKSKSIEHIIPESLGNLTQTLPPGVVCDKCNNYFSRKVEKPFLESAAILHLRFHHEIPSKRGKIPPIKGLLTPNFQAILRRDPKSHFAASVEVEPKAIKHIMSSNKGTIIFPAGGDPPKDIVISRFLAKVALEAMAQRLVAYPGGLKYLVNETQLNPIRNHARKGETPNWPFNVRRIYNTNQKWIDEIGSVGKEDRKKKAGDSAHSPAELTYKPLSRSSWTAWLFRDDAHALAMEQDTPRALGKQSVVPSQADVGARMELGAALSHYDAAGSDGLAAVALDAAELRVAVAPVPCGALAFLMSHWCSPSVSLLALVRPVRRAAAGKG